MTSIRVLLEHAPAMTEEALDDFHLELIELLKKHQLLLMEYGPEKKHEPIRQETRDLTQKIVDCWNEGRPHPIQVTPLRSIKVQGRRNDGFTQAELMTVVQKLKSSAFHNGDNERSWAASGPEWVLHSTERVEQWLKKTERVVMSYADEVKKHFGNVHA